MAGWIPRRLREEDRVARLERRLEDLESWVRGVGSITERVHKLEQATAPFRIDDGRDIYFYGSEDTRPKVSLRDAINLICVHLKLRFKHVKSVPERVEVEKSK